MKVPIRFISIFILFIILSGCGSFQNDQDSINESSPSFEEGSGKVIGQITNLEEIWPGRTIYIFAAIFYGEPDGEGSFILEPSTFPKTRVQDDGSFQIDNLPGRNYVFIVGPYAEAGLILGGKSSSSVIAVRDGEEINLGDILITE
ncbi:MAG: hypothetical protein ACXADB_04745 [Candidatus Hermodarchaeia archaeon]